MKSKTLAVVLGALVIVSLSGCDSLGRLLANKSFAKMEQKIADQQELIDQLNVRLEANSESGETEVEATSRNISSMFRRSRD